MKKVNFVGKVWLIFYVFTLFLTVVGAQAESSSTSSQTTSESTTTSSSSQSTSQSSADSTDSSQSEDQSTSGDEVVSEVEESSDEADSSQSEEETQAITTFVGPQTDVSVSTVAELKSAVANTSVENITITKDIALGNNSLPVNHDVVIDGAKADGGRYTLTYGGTGSRTNGIYFSTNNVTIHYKNLNFGYKSALGNTNASNAGNFFGIAPPGASSINNRTLIIENVGYYSDRGAQPLYVNGANDQIIFRGSNEFILRGTDNNSEEFAEAANLTFESGSNTTIDDGNMYTSSGIIYQFIWSYYAPLNFQVESNATVNITTSRDFLYTSGASGSQTGQIDVAANGKLTINQSDTTTPGSRGRFIYQPGKDFNITLGDAATFAVKTKNSSTFANLNVTLAENSAAEFKSSDGVFDSGSTSTFNINNASSLVFDGATDGPIGGNSTINFSSFSSETLGYSVYIGSNPSSHLLSETDNSNSPWTVTGGSFSRAGVGFTSEEQTSLNSTKRLAIERDTNVALSWYSDSIQHTKSEAVAVGHFGDKFFYKDPDADDELTFRIYKGGTQVGSDINVTSVGDDNYHQVDYYISQDDLPVGDNVFTIDVIRTEDDDSEVVKDTLTLNINITLPALTLESVTTNLKWTNRTMTETKGILTRDSGNIFEIKVSDTRPSPQNWVVVANVSGTAPFSLVWKADSSATTTDLSNRELFRNTDVTKDENDVYTKTWAEDLGVLLNSPNYLPINDYTGLLTISWNLYNVGATG